MAVDAKHAGDIMRYSPFIQVDELSAKYQAVRVEEVEDGWKDGYERSLTHCMHGPSCQTGPSCQASLE